jgi:hypothetical protein
MLISRVHPRVSRSGRDAHLIVAVGAQCRLHPDITIIIATAIRARARPGQLLWWSANATRVRRGVRAT